MKKPTQQEVREFLYESNLIEGVYDEVSLIDAVFAWEYLIEQPSLTADVILKTHKILMQNQKDLSPSEKGSFRKIPVYISGREGIKSELIPRAIEGWCAVVNMAPYEWKKAHVAYEQIHPFVDGNGRTGRMFMNWQRLKFGVPLLILKADERGEYYKWFK